MIPNNLPTLMGISDSMDQAIEAALKESSLENQLVAASRAARIRVHLAQPMTLRTYARRRPSPPRTTHTISRLFKSGNTVCVTRINGRYGYPIPTTFLESIKSWEAIPRGDSRLFSSYKQFKRRFDTRFITEDEIKRLYNSKSSQHGGHYRPSDFKKLGRQGRAVMERFLKKFKDVHTVTPFHTKRDEGYSILRESYNSWHHAGRDITISHQSNLEWIYYASEFHGCGNGRYGLIANETTYLWLEDD